MLHFEACLALTKSFLVLAFMILEFVEYITIHFDVYIFVNIDLFII